MPDLSKNIIPTLVQQFYKDLVAVDPTPNNLSVREAERAASEHGRITEEIVDHLQLEIDHHVYSERTVKLAEQTLARNGIGRGDVSKEVFSALCNGVARAELEFTRFLDFRQHEPILPYVPIDPLLTSAPSVISKSTQPEQATGHLIAPNHLLKTSVTTVSSAIDQYIAFKTENEEGGSSAWKSVDVPSKRRPLDWFATLAGPEISISDLALANFRLFRDKIKRLKKNAPAGVDIREHQAKQAEDRIHPKTAKQHFHAVKAFLNWLSAEGLVESDLVGGISLGLKAQISPERSLSTSQLDAFLTSPLFSGFADPAKRYEKGSDVLKDAEFWLPLIALYTGARMGELLQLRGGDFEFGQTCSYFAIQPDSQLKNNQSARDVPIHADLLEWGLKEFVLKANPKERVFDSIKLSSPKLTSYYSQLFSRYLTNAKLKTDGFVFHSFRHTFLDAARNANIEEAKCRKIVGHSSNSPHEGYGKGADIQNLFDQIQKINFGLSAETRGILNP